MLRFDPALSRELEPAAAVAAVQACTAPVLWARRRQRWHPRPAESGTLGLLVLEGLLVRSLHVRDRRCAELLGPGDLLCPWVSDGESVPATATWRVERDVVLADLDRTFLEAAGRWPEVIVRLSERGLRRQRSLALRLAIAQEGVADRLHLLFWHLADRWGEIRSDGVALPLRLTQELLADLVCTQRTLDRPSAGRARVAGSGV